MTNKERLLAYLNAQEKGTCVWTSIQEQQDGSYRFGYDYTGLTDLLPAAIPVTEAEYQELLAEAGISQEQEGA